MSLFTFSETIHGKFGHALFVATPLPKFRKDEFRKLLMFASEVGGTYSDLRGGDKIPGFQFRTPEARLVFVRRAKEMALASVPPWQRADPKMIYADGRIGLARVTQ